MFQLDSFISKYVTRRDTSLFEKDINRYGDQLSEAINGRRFLVIGGAGSIGSSYIRAVLRFRPKSMTVVDINENGLAELVRDLRSNEQVNMPEEFLTYPMNYADPLFEKMFRVNGGYDVVANFSAHKHVRSEKDVFSVQALLENNVTRARNLLRLMEEFPPQRFFCVSTDKAANPVNVMGGSKKIMEDMIMAYAPLFNVTTARFANVAFSNGSLPQAFLARIEKGQPLAAPNDVTRYFVSPQESGQICMLACMLGKSGEIFFPKLEKAQMMGFAEIAESLLKELGYTPRYCASEDEARHLAAIRLVDDKWYPVLFSGSNTTGEKAYEEFFTENEQVDMLRFTALGVVTETPRKTMSEIDTLFVELQRLFDAQDTTKEHLVAVMRRFLVNFAHEERGLSLDDKM